MKLRLRLPTSVLGQFFLHMAIIFTTAGGFLSMIVWLGYITVTPTTKNEFGPDKTFVVDKESPTYNAFRPITKFDFGPKNFLYYVQDANDSNMKECRIIIRRKEDGIFFVAELKNPNISLQRGQRMKLELIQYWRSPGVRAEYLIAEP